MIKSELIQVVTAFQLGGAEVVATDLCLSAARQGMSVTACAVRPTEREVGKDIVKRLNSAGVECIILSEGSSVVDAVAAGFRLARLVKKRRPQLVHLHTDIPDFVGSIARRLTSFPAARTIHNTVLWPTKPRIAQFVEGAYLDDLVVSVASAPADAYASLRSKCKLKPSRYQKIIYNGVERPKLSRSDARSALVNIKDWDAAKLHLCFAGRFSHQKGFDILIEALDLLPVEALSNIRVHAFGYDPSSALKSKMKSIDLLPVEFHEPISDLREHFAAFDAILMPSRFEGFGLVAAEALVANVPVLASDINGLAEALPADWPAKFSSENILEFRTLLSRFISREKSLLDSIEKSMARHIVRSKADMWNDYYAAYNQYIDVVGGNRA